MTYKTKFFIFLAILHLVEVAMAAIILHNNKIWFIASELLILISMGISVYFLMSFSKSLQLVNSGIESIKDKDFSMRLIKVGQPELDSLIEVYNQMIDRLRSERTLQQEQHLFLEQLLKASPSGIIILDPDEKIKMINPAAGIFTGISLEEGRGHLLQSFTANPLMNELANIPLNETSTILLSGLKKFKAHKSYFVNQGFRNQFLVLEELTEEIYQIERAAYEKVIRTISHEFNNSIGPINSILESLNTHIRKTASEHQTDIENAIEVAMQRNNSLNGFIKRYAEIFKLPLPLREKCNIVELLQRMERIFHYDLQHKNIKLTLPSVEKKMVQNIDVNQFELVVSNIIKNSIEAIGNNGQIEISISTDPASLTIRNNGEPISAEVQKQLFTPFFTTKNSGQGIGLTLVREILQNHGLKFSLQSLDNGNTEFVIYF